MCCHDTQCQHILPEPLPEIQKLNSRKREFYSVAPVILTMYQISVSLGCIVLVGMIFKIALGVAVLGLIENCSMNSGLGLGQNLQ